MAIEVRREGRVAVLTINRPDALNALSSALLEELRSELTAIAQDDSVGCLIITGAGEKAFIAGADIAEMATKTPLEARAYAELGQECANLLETMRAPSIAAVNGYALGGGSEIALACDIRLCSENAVFGQPEVDLGIMPGWGATQRLARTTSIGFAKELIFTGRRVDAQEALARGIAQHVLPLDELMPKALEMAQAISAKSPVAIAYAKEATNRALAGDLATNYMVEADLFSILFSTEDAKEGLRAFTEKRAPEFKGR